MKGERELLQRFGYWQGYVCGQEQSKQPNEEKLKEARTRLNEISWALEGTDHDTDTPQV